jgi:hypothetical protein
MCKTDLPTAIERVPQSSHVTSCMACRRQRRIAALCQPVREPAATIPSCPQRINHVIPAATGQLLALVLQCPDVQRPLQRAPCGQLSPLQWRAMALLQPQSCSLHKRCFKTHVGPVRLLALAKHNHSDGFLRRHKSTPYNRQIARTVQSGSDGSNNGAQASRDVNLEVGRHAPLGAGSSPIDTRPSVC